MNKKQIIAKFNSIVESLKDNKPLGVNCYSCNCGHITKTIDIDPGTTPFLFTCEKCGDMARSSFYIDRTPDQKPTIEWYRPTIEEVLKLRKEPGLLEHILNGGLEYRKIKRGWIKRN